MVNTFSKSIIEYLEELPKNVQSLLYRAPTTCLSVFRLLPPLAKFYILSILFIEKKILKKDLEKWCKPESKKIEFESINSLNLLHLIIEDKTLGTIELNSTFKKNFRNFLTGVLTNDEICELSIDEKNENINEEFLDNFSRNKWESILHFIVGSQNKLKPSQFILSLLKQGNLMNENSEKKDEFIITKFGFQFLLENMNVQLWTLLFQYLDINSGLEMNLVGSLNFIFLLGTLEPGKCYKILSMSKTQISMLSYLMELGMIYKESKTSKYFYPTVLAIKFTSDCSITQFSLIEANENLDTNIEKNTNKETGFSNNISMIVESNFKFYAYTKSKLQICILNLFSTLKTRFPNMVCGVITRESIRKALLNGITSDQIIKFLESHAHPQMVLYANEKKKKKIFDLYRTDSDFLTKNDFNKTSAQSTKRELTILPPTVVDQIMLWGFEIDRIKTCEGYLFKDIHDEKEFNLLRCYASDIGVLVWSDSQTKKFFIHKKGINQLAEFTNEKLKRKN